VRLLVENRVEAIAAAIITLAPAAAVVDSIQTVALRDLPQRPGSITQVDRLGEVVVAVGLWGCCGAVGLLGGLTWCEREPHSD
jgi:predicted ATP-dependent serine protease